MASDQATAYTKRKPQDADWYDAHEKSTGDEEIAKGLGLGGKVEGKCPKDLEWLKREAIEVYLTMNKEKSKFTGRFGRMFLEELGYELEKRALQATGWEHLMDVPTAWRERTFQVLIKQAGTNLSRHPLSIPDKSRGDANTQPSKVSKEKVQSRSLLADAPHDLPHSDVPKRRYNTLAEYTEDVQRQMRTEDIPCSRHSLPGPKGTATTTRATVGSPRKATVTVSYLNRDGRVKKKKLEGDNIGAWKTVAEKLAGILDCDPDQVMSMHMKQA